MSSAFSAEGEAGEEKEQSLRVTPALRSLGDLLRRLCKCLSPLMEKSLLCPCMWALLRGSGPDLKQFVLLQSPL